ncbi:glycosyltransferase [Dongia sedimenti]|uniref:Glycosyltransferase n=1 Tax=Dongia sedimenti TaxID=3064282 RepID=A0ABU0YTF9_9PROT|nr:glycosyltransferase [Rhodospirillaceae bacterium R-7]
MPSLSFILSIVAVGIWTYLLLFRGLFWRETPQAVSAPALDSWPEVVVATPARNEADVVGQSMAALLAQDYPGTIHIVLVDDDSSDGTAAAAERAAAKSKTRHKLTVVKNAALAPGWTGKLWAVNRGLAEAEHLAPGAKYVLLTDADILHERTSLRQLVGKAEQGGFKLVSLMARLKTGTLAERALIPAYIFYFQKLYPFAWVSDPGNRMAGAAGGCMLVDRATLNAIGGIAAIRGELIDDCALGKAIKAKGPISLALADGVASLRGYPRWADVWMLIARSAFTQLGFSVAMLVVATVMMLATYVMPLALVLFAEGPARLLGAVAFLMMAFAYQPTLRYHRLSALWALALPLVASFYTAATIDSAVRYWSGRGGQWKGRMQAQGLAKGRAEGEA